MSRLTGLPHERCTLRSSHSALAEAARRAAAPGPIWFAGLCYPTLSMSLFFGWEVVLGARLEGDAAITSVISPLIFFPIFRLAPGLARVSAPASWDRAVAAGRRPGLREAWRAGRGLLLSSMALWLQVALLLALVLALSYGIFDWATEHSTTLVVASLVGGPVLLMMGAYALILSVLYQLALHSLAQNRRGVASALQHAWRLARNDPWATVRATFVDFEISVVFFGLARLVSGLLTEPANVMLLGSMLGLIGVARAGYWARTYRALGGLAPDDGIPGLGVEAAPAGEAG